MRSRHSPPGSDPGRVDRVRRDARCEVLAPPVPGRQLSGLWHRVSPSRWGGLRRRYRVVDGAIDRSPLMGRVFAGVTPVGTSPSEFGGSDGEREGKGETVAWGLVTHTRFE